MQFAPLPHNESERLAALHAYSILDTLPEKDLDEIAKMASIICDTPISLITLIDKDRNWYKAKLGMEGDEAPRELSFCTHAILDPDQMLTVSDSRLDERFHDNPYVTGDPHVVFYSGIPLVDNDGFALGTLCVIDHKPKKLDRVQKIALKALANQIIRIFDLRRINLALEQSQKELLETNKELEIFAVHAAHDMKSPLNQIHQVVDILMEDHHSKLDDEAKDYMQYLKRASIRLGHFIDGMLKHSRTSTHIDKHKEDINFTEFVTNLRSLIDFREEIDFTFPQDNKIIHVNNSALEQVLLNLIANAIKYNDKEKIRIEISYSEDDNQYYFYVKDNGPGIPDKYKEKIFVLFQVLNNADRFGEQSTGIGLATVKKLVESLGGTISVESELGQGSTFKFSICK